jgi:hypothetical protein
MYIYIFLKSLENEKNAKKARTVSDIWFQWQLTAITLGYFGPQSDRRPGCNLPPHSADPPYGPRPTSDPLLHRLGSSALGELPRGGRSDPVVPSRASAPASYCTRAAASSPSAIAPPPPLLLSQTLTGPGAGPHEEAAMRSAASATTD